MRVFAAATLGREHPSEKVSFQRIRELKFEGHCSTIVRVLRQVSFLRVPVFGCRWWRNLVTEAGAACKYTVIANQINIWGF